MSDRAETTYELWQAGMMVASVTSTSKAQAMKEIARYAHQYAQDGPIEIKEPMGNDYRENNDV